MSMESWRNVERSTDRRKVVESMEEPADDEERHSPTIWEKFVPVS